MDSPGLCIHIGNGFIEGTAVVTKNDAISRLQELCYIVEHVNWRSVIPEPFGGSSSPCSGLLSPCSSLCSGIGCSGIASFLASFFFD